MLVIIHSFLSYLTHSFNPRTPLRSRITYAYVQLKVGNGTETERKLETNICDNKYRIRADSYL